MNTRKWFGALAVVVVMVFAITFASVYMGPRGDNGKSTPETATGENRPTLTFLTPLPDRNNPDFLDVEVNQSGSNDFWFQNDNPQDLEVGLAGLSARQVKIYLVPGEKTIPLLTLAAAEVGTCCLGTLSPVAALPVLRSLSQHRLEAEVAPTVLERGQNSVSVPAGAVGWVRVDWIAQPGNTRRGGLLWLGTKDNIHNPVGVVLRIQPALRAPLHWTLDSASTAQLPRQAFIPCWSSTRHHFRVKARIRDGEAGDPIVVGEPIPLTREEIRQLEKENNPPPAKKPDPERDARRGKVLSGYWIPLTLRPTYTGGKQGIDLGIFERTVELSSEDAGVEPVAVRVRGRIEGEVRVGEDELVFGEFNRRSEVRRSLSLVSEESGPEVEVDRERSAAFAEVELKENEKVGGSRSWLLRVGIRPNQVSGHFPSRDDAAYQDSAVYLKVRYRDKGKVPRILRIPLSGTATEGQ